MDKLHLDDAGFSGAEVVSSGDSDAGPFGAEVSRALVAINALRLYMEGAGPELQRDAAALAAALSHIDAALGAAVRALHGALPGDDETA